jgi:hypothetical protein
MGAIYACGALIAFLTPGAYDSVRYALLACALASFVIAGWRFAERFVKPS